MGATVTNTQKGFTIVELLIAIIIIGILTLLSVTTYSGIDNRSKQQRANDDMLQLSRLIKLAVVTQNKPLYQITGNQWTLGECYYASTGSARPMYNFDKSSTCWTNYRATLSAIITASGTEASRTTLMDGDPWGSPYLIDENEGASPADPCARDILSSAGKRGVVFFETTQSFELGYSFMSGKDSSGNPCPLP